MAAQSKPSSPSAPKKPSPATTADLEAMQVLKRSSCLKLSGNSTLRYEFALDPTKASIVPVTGWVV